MIGDGEKLLCGSLHETLYAKGTGIHFYRFPADVERRARWIAAIERKNFVPTEHIWLCSAHFISRQKSNDPLSPDYVPSVFVHTKSPVKRKLVEGMHRFERVSAAKRRRAENNKRMAAAESLVSLAAGGNGIDYCEPYSGTGTMTAISMMDIRAMETERLNLVEQNEELRQTQPFT